MRAESDLRREVIKGMLDPRSVVHADSRQVQPQRRAQPFPPIERIGHEVWFQDGI